jgi:glycosyltransferase involved in cell wall biosynthesis
MTPPPVRVLQVALSLDPGGTERLVVELARRLPDGFQSAVCCLDGPGAWSPDLRREGIPVHALHRKPGFHPGLGARIAAVARETGASVLHCHQYTPYVYGCLAKLLRPGLRLVFTEHGRLSEAPPSPRRARVNPWLARIPGVRFAVCEELRAFLIAEGFPAQGIGVVYNGIDVGPAPGAGERSEARAALGLAPEAFVVGTVARLDPVKDLATAIAAIAQVRAARPDACLAILGDGPERAALEAAARDAGAEGAVTFFGNRTDVRRLLPGFDLYLNCSRYEGVSLTIVEAMAAALPVIATRVGGTPEVVEEGATGILVPPADPGRVAATVLELAGSPERRAALGRAGRAAAETRFTFERMRDEYVAAYVGRG